MFSCSVFFVVIIICHNVMERPLCVLSPREIGFEMFLRFDLKIDDCGSI